MEINEVTIPASEYNKLLKESNLLNALMAAGVSYWDGWDYAHELMENVK